MSAAEGFAATRASNDPLEERRETATTTTGSNTFMTTDADSQHARVI
jgi:hypothetical protein